MGTPPRKAQAVLPLGLGADEKDLVRAPRLPSGHMRSVQVYLAFGFAGCNAHLDQATVAFRDVGGSRDSKAAIQVRDFVSRSGQGIDLPKDR